MMKHLYNYIFEKLKITKDSKAPSKKGIPKKGEKVIVFYKDKKNLLYFGKIKDIKIKDNEIEEFKVEYSYDAKKKETWFFYIPESKYNFIGASEIPNASIYTYEYTLNEVKRILKEDDDKFDGHTFTDFSNGLITVKEFFTAIRDIIERGE